jgi:hypothetical protein
VVKIQTSVTTSESQSFQARVFYKTLFEKTQRQSCDVTLATGRNRCHLLDLLPLQSISALVLPEAEADQL